MDKKLLEVLVALATAVLMAAVIYGAAVFLFWNVVWATQVWQREVLQCVSQ